MQTAVGVCLAVARRYWSDEFCPGQVPAGSVCTTPPARPPVKGEGASRLWGGLPAWR